MLFQMRDDDPGVIERLERELHSMTAEVSAQGRCSVAIERLRTGTTRPDGIPHSSTRSKPPAKPSPAAGRSGCPQPPDRRPDSIDHYAIRHAVCALDRRHQSSLSENTDDADIITGAQVFVDACRAACCHDEQLRPAVAIAQHNQLFASHRDSIRQNRPRVSPNFCRDLARSRAQ